MEKYLVHHGILGQKWGVRRFQNEDGTLTEAGKRRQKRAEKKKQSDLKEARNILVADNDYEKLCDYYLKNETNFYDEYGYESKSEFIKEINEAKKAFKKEHELTSNYINRLEKINPMKKSEVKELGKQYSESIYRENIMNMIPDWFMNALDASYSVLDD